MTDIEQTLHDLELRLVERDRLIHRLTAATKRVEEVRRRRAHLAEVLEREDADVARLEGLTLTALFRTMFSDKEERLAKERAEALKARLEYESCDASLRLAESEVEQLSCSLESFSGIDEQVVAAQEAREEFLRGLDDWRGKELLRLAEQRAELSARAHRMREAQRYGMTAYSSIEELNAALLAAKSASNWDVLGGNALATALKRSRLDGARALVEQAEDDLDRFDAELAAIGVAGETFHELDVDIPHHFADYLLDCLIVDWRIHGEIKESLARTRETMELIRELVEHLDTRVAELVEQTAALAERRIALIRR